jgi:hypothetical protein
LGCDTFREKGVDVSPQVVSRAAVGEEVGIVVLAYMPVELPPRVGRAVVLLEKTGGNVVLVSIIRVGKDGVTVSVTVTTLVVMSAAAVMVVRGTPRHEQAEEKAPGDEQGDAYAGIAVGTTVVCRLRSVLPGRTWRMCTGPNTLRILCSVPSSGMSLFLDESDSSVVVTVTVLWTVLGLGVTVTRKNETQSAVPFLFAEGSL